MTTQSNIEKELKFIIDAKVSCTEIKEFLNNLGLAFERRDLLTDVYWDTPSYNIINLKRGLRVRYVSERLKDIEFKSLFLDKEGKYAVEEIKLFDNYQINRNALRKILVDRLSICKEFSLNESLSPEDYLTQIGLMPAMTLKKSRTIFVDTQKSIEVCLDEVENLGTFLEVEEINDANSLFEKTIDELNKSGFTTLDDSHAGYIDLIMSKNAEILSKVDFEKKYAENYKWNVKPGEQDIYLSLTEI